MKKILTMITLSILFLVGCGDSTQSGDTKVDKSSSAPKSVEDTAKNVVEDGKKAMDIIMDTTKKELSKVYENNKEDIDSAIEKTKEQGAKIMQTAQESMKELQQATENFAKEAGKSLEKTVNESTKALASLSSSAAESNASSSLNNMLKDSTEKKYNPDNFNKMSVAKYYDLRCSSCHGNYGERKALNKSAIIGTWEAKDISHALHGYKAQTYGGTMKKTMFAYTKALNDEEIEQLAEYISTF
ncbi:cytochrome c family protein [Campylobacter blaseri]|uniref:Cytochrome c domain-containing protein n=1 Tax=Campylobacter blaseri TaxID=2042961 RepID=A0A2P8R3Y1_9BACT|nr:c-type cytochrome [Campylobacter blaseri]PSM53211.1 hypothetical protein CQ405_01290 [Campylobacter blaseri]PSM54677.1 hypothetical protein CRN67_01290 [Campylobacter blaseri]QKF86846.1 cytochrome c family protein [Campylobacter blaseri]